MDHAPEREADGDTSMSAALHRSTFDDMLAAIAMAAQDRTPRGMTARPRRVAEALGRYVMAPDLLAGFDLPGAAERYTRHLLSENPRGEYAVAALVWRPGQMSCVHGHRTWCALAVHCGVLTETLYTPAADPDGLPEPRASALRRSGDVSYGTAGAAGAGSIHRMANLGTRDAISVHVYGVRFEHFSTSVNFVLAG